MSNRRATITQAEVARIIRAAKQAGAAEVTFKIGEQPITVKLESSTGTVPALELEERIRL